MKYNLSQEVVLASGIRKKGLRKGEVATAVDHHPASAGEDAYSLEVFNTLGGTLAVITMPESLMEQLPENEIFVVRSLATRPRKRRCRHRDRGPDL